MSKLLESRKLEYDQIKKLLDGRIKFLESEESSHIIDDINVNQDDSTICIMLKDYDEDDENAFVVTYAESVINVQYIKMQAYNNDGTIVHLYSLNKMTEPELSIILESSEYLTINRLSEDCYAVQVKKIPAHILASMRDDDSYPCIEIESSADIVSNRFAYKTNIYAYLSGLDIDRVLVHSIIGDNYSTHLAMVNYIATSFKQLNTTDITVGSYIVERLENMDTMYKVEVVKKEYLECISLINESKHVKYEYRYLSEPNVVILPASALFTYCTAEGAILAEHPEMDDIDAIDILNIENSATMVINTINKINNGIDVEALSKLLAKKNEGKRILKTNKPVKSIIELSNHIVAAITALEELQNQQNGGFDYIQIYDIDNCRYKRFNETDLSYSMQACSNWLEMLGIRK